MIFAVVISLILAPVVYGLYAEWKRERGIDDLKPLSNGRKPR